MSNRILHLTLRDHALDPAAAEVHVQLTPEHVTPATELRGRLMGPRCRYANTIEVAYHLRPLGPGAAPPPGALAARALIPEPSLWDPASPLLYYGPVELWQDGARADSARVSHGLRTLHLSRAGLRVNGRALTLRGRRVARLPPEEEALAWRAGGYNLLVAPADAGEDLWHLADSLGFLVLARPPAGRPAPPREQHASHLGWLVPAGQTPEVPPGSLVGVEWAGAAPDTPPQGAAFVACPPELLPAAQTLGLPVLVLGPPGAVPGGPAPVVLGSVG
jgi:hypothetical protein